MSEQYAKVPPAVPLLLQEVFAKCDDWDTALGLLRALLPELQAQSRDQVTRAMGREAEPAPIGRFDVYLDGGLNLFGAEGACQDMDCRLDAADRLCRSVGLFADRVWLTDHLSDYFLEVDQLSDQDLAVILNDVLVLGRLAPLIDAGVVQFSSPWIPACKECSDAFEGTLSELTESLTKDYLAGFHVERTGGRSYAIHTGDAYYPSIVLRGSGPRNAERRRNRELARNVVYRAVRGTMWIARDASIGRGSVFSNSRIGLAGVAAHEGRVRSGADFRLLDDSRSVEIPWVSELSPAQVMQLREEASRALPTLRELLSAGLTYREDGNHGDSHAVIDQLRYQAAEVKGELGLVGKKASRYWGSPYALLGLGVSLIGLVADEPVSAAAGLLSLLELIRGHREGGEQDMVRLRSKPGYVLVKAQDLLAHR